LDIADGYGFHSMLSRLALQAGQVNPPGQRKCTKKAAHAALSGNISANSLYVFGWSRDTEAGSLGFIHHTMQKIHLLCIIIIRPALTDRPLRNILFLLGESKRVKVVFMELP